MGAQVLLESVPKGLHQPPCSIPPGPLCPPHHSREYPSVPLRTNNNQPFGQVSAGSEEPLEEAEGDASGVAALQAHLVLRALCCGPLCARH
jgi:hypothetical protein